MAPLVFMHIPKTGGMGIDQWIARSQGPNVFWYPSSYMEQALVEVPDWAEFVVGHTPADLPGTYITVLRDPAERVHSLYYAHMKYGDFPHKRLSLFEFVEQAPYPEIDNGMTRRLAGALDLDRALARLREFAFVTHRPSALVQWVLSKYGMPRPTTYHATNINAARPALTTRERKFILKHNALDRELYGTFFNRV